MSLNATPSGERIHIGFFGRRNAGKSSVVNAVTDQNLAVVSDVKGTTTDPVLKAMELLPLGPVMIIDTPGFDDEGALGELRKAKTRQILNKTDIAVLIVDGTEGLKDCDQDLISLFQAKAIPYLIVKNKLDLITGVPEPEENTLWVSAVKKQNIHALKEQLASLSQVEKPEYPIVKDLIKPRDLVVLVVPIDKAAPKGRLILPQQQTIRDILDAGAVSVVCQQDELKNTLAALGKKPAMVITDSQVFKTVAQDTPEEIPLTSFSILMARHKGLLSSAVTGAAAIEKLKDGDTILMAEGCSHHRQCGDIGSVKIPNLLKKHTGKALNIATCSGTEFPEDLTPYALVIHCGGCMLNPREVMYRVSCAEDQDVPITNYGIAIAHMNGILKRSISLFPDLLYSAKNV